MPVGSIGVFRSSRFAPSFWSLVGLIQYPGSCRSAQVTEIATVRCQQSNELTPDDLSSATVGEAIVRADLTHQRFDVRSIYALAKKSQLRILVCIRHVYEPAAWRYAVVAIPARRSRSKAAQNTVLATGFQGCGQPGKVEVTHCTTVFVSIFADNLIRPPAQAVRRAQNAHTLGFSHNVAAIFA